MCRFFHRRTWDETLIKFSTNVSGNRDDLALHAFLNFGTNVKFPTLFQQISSPLGNTSIANQPILEPEKNRSIEIGFDVIKDVQTSAGMDGWQFSSTFFQNFYENKFRISYTPGVPLAFYDNVQNNKEPKTTVHDALKHTRFVYQVLAAL